MKRVAHRLHDSHGTVQAQVVLPEEHPYFPEPWMIHRVNTEGWYLKADVLPEESGVAVHGWADWRLVAETLALALRPILDDSVALSEEEAETLLEQAQQALDDYDIAVTEVGLTQDAEEPEHDDEEDGSDGDDD